MQNAFLAQALVTSKRASGLGFALRWQRNQSQMIASDPRRPAQGWAPQHVTRHLPFLNLRRMWTLHPLVPKSECHFTSCHYLWSPLFVLGRTLTCHRSWVGRPGWASPRLLIFSELCPSYTLVTLTWREGGWEQGVLIPSSYKDTNQIYCIRSRPHDLILPKLPL